MATFVGKNLKKENGIVDKELVNSEDTGYKPGKKIPFKKAIIHFGLGLLGGTASFLLAWAILSIPALGVHYILKSLLAALFAFLVIKSYDRASGEASSPVSMAVASAVVILSIITLIYGYNSNKDINDNKQATEQVIAPLETLTLTTIESFPMTSKCYHIGEQVKVVVIGNSVKMALGEVLPEGAHTINVESDGRLCFHIENNIPAKVEVY